MAELHRIESRPQQIVNGYKCDRCDNEVLGQFPNNWFSFSHSHQEWGNDSGDSYEHFHVCSIACFADQLKESLSEMLDYKRSAEIAGMPYEFAEKLYDIIK